MLRNSAFPAGGRTGGGRQPGNGHKQQNGKADDSGETKFRATNGSQLESGFAHVDLFISRLRDSHRK
jgi:hypothetical protein